jgi:putative transcriptional regulator
MRFQCNAPEKVQNRIMGINRAVLFAWATGILLAPMPCAAQSTRPEDLAQGKIIVSPRDAPDPHFADSVIVLAKFDQTGALGLMLHFKSDLTIQRALNGLTGAEKRTDTVYVGGPVEIPVVLALLRSKATPEGGSHVAGNLYLMTSKQSIGTALTEGRPAADLRIFLGYSGWGPGQLDREVRHSGWFIFNYDEAVVFDEHPGTLWNRMIEKTERRLAALTLWNPWEYGLPGLR